ncbi:mechanosensitive ion channel domain-containing protein [Methylobacter psychrophilus]|uniref:mechanosensitive ion channel domain-containing protein n=1 Tax=Methylobacter psychrophilus TaxID=96941 RepID=UPI0021D50654|nr:mechanosensitive ion channel domain-containing protein [Methylobacter psychrophilus]
MKFIDFSAFYCKISVLLFLLLLGFFGSTETWAKKVAPAREQNGTALEITKGTLQANIEAINNRQGLDEALKAKVLSTYQSALDNLSNSENFKARIVEFNQAIKQAPQKTKQLQKEIEQTLLQVSKQKLEDFTRIPTEELDQRLIIEKAKISALDEQIGKLENELALQQTRPQLIREEMVTAKQDFEAIQSKLAGSSNKTGSKLESEAEQIYLKTQLASRAAELKMLDSEAISNPIRVELLNTDFRLLDIQKNALLPAISAIENVLTDRRQQEVKEMQDALSQAEKELSGKHPLIQAISRENIQYTRDLQAITAKIDSYTEQKTRLDAQANEIDNDFKSAEKKISLAGLSPVLGKILREQRRNLTTQDQATIQSESIQDETAATSLEQYKDEYKLKQLADIDADLQEIMENQVDHNLPVAERMMIQAELRVLLNNQKELLNKLASDYITYLRTLGDFDFARQQMVKQATKFAAYLDENLLWVKSSNAIDTDYAVGLFNSTKWLLSPLNWLALTKDVLKVATQQPFFMVIGILGLVLLYLGKNWAKKQLLIISVKIEKIYTDTFNYTLQALAYTLIVVLPVPLLSYYLGWCLTNNIHIIDFTRAIGEGLKSAAIPLLFLQFFYRLFADDGIARKHFRWKKTNTSLLRKQIGWVRFFVVLAIFIINTTAASKEPIYSDNLGRLAFIINMLALTIFLGRLLNPAHGLLQGIIKNNPDGWLTKFRYIWYPTAIFTPLIIIGFAVTGYYLSALELQDQLVLSLRLIFVMVLINEMVIRWLTVINRQLAIKNVMQKRKAAELNEKQPVAGVEDPVLPIDEQLIDIPKINAQTIKLLNVFITLSLIIGIWIIWKNILPAFSFLERIVLWQHVVTIDNQQSYQPITLINLMWSGLYFFLAVVSVRNFPGVMELLVFRRLAIETGGRYAVNQLATYVLITISFVSIANELGGSWSQVQWLVAALSVGLGFGLQEIFANLVSGIILLFERPIRVGDTVTIGNVTGKVCRIKMRATTLIDFDAKELIIPNKTFITSQLNNWTLSDTVTRIVVPIGIAYGSDIELAHKVMVDAVQSMPLILKDPAPAVLIDSFGDSSLNFSIRFFVSELANRLPATHELHILLEKGLRENKIEIPFPQRDIHIRSVPQEYGTINPEIKKTVEPNSPPVQSSFNPALFE